jgi:hypothetical protein
MMEKSCFLEAGAVQLHRSTVRKEQEAGQQKIVQPRNEVTGRLELHDGLEERQWQDGTIPRSEIPMGPLEDSGVPATSFRAAFIRAELAGERAFPL